jgi:cysteinyl-tRNA synthetase
MESKPAFTQEQKDNFKEKMMRIHIKPQVLFRRFPNLYSAFDSDGVPTHDASGNEIKKSLIARMKRDWRQQCKTYVENDV